jgi:uncharacterized DUF497 family protein
MRFEWDRLKDEENRTKHGVSFEEASSVSLTHWRLRFQIRTIHRPKCDT